jgi:two-component system, OmpR family, phosphate regulon sensor histidine kinase PhoR
VAQTSELIEFRRAFVWLLCGMLLPSVALVAFGFVAVANERAAVERRLADEYAARLQVLGRDLSARLDQAARTSVGRQLDPLVEAIHAPGPELEGAARKAAEPSHNGEPLYTNVDQRAYALVPSAEGVRALRLDIDAIAAEIPRLAAARFPRERATFRLTPRTAGFANLRRIVAEAGANATVVARLALPQPLDGFLLAAELPGDDPAAALAFRNRTLYIALLVLLYIGIGVGFGLTLREMRRAYRLSRLKTDFVANISHELRTPLTSVRLFAETLREGRAESPEEVRQCVELLSGEAERLSRLVETLLHWSRLESGRAPLRLESISVQTLFASIDKTWRAQQLPATYTTRIEPGLPPLPVDGEALAQVVLNLLHNAFKYTGADKRIELRARREEKMTAIEVQDNGIGIRAQDKKRIFERFYRADDLLSRGTEGTGLGLAIAKKIVEAHGGRIELDSKAGEGSTFRILIPVA